MNDVDPQSLAAAARRYVRLRRWYWRSWLGLWIIGGVIGVSVSLISQWLSVEARDTCFGMIIAGFLACYLAAFVSWMRLSRFRCPRCGGLFIISRESSWPASACKHCRLELIPPR